MKWLLTAPCESLHLVLLTLPLFENSALIGHPQVTRLSGGIGLCSLTGESSKIKKIKMNRYCQTVHATNELPKGKFIDATVTIFNQLLLLVTIYGPV